MSTGGFAARSNSDCVVAVQLNFFCGVRRYVVLEMRGQLKEVRSLFLRHIIPIRGLGSGEVRSGMAGLTNPTQLGSPRFDRDMPPIALVRIMSVIACYQHRCCLLVKLAFI